MNASFHSDPDVFFLPLAVRHPRRFRGVDPWVLARRLPDFLHQVLNRGDVGPTGILEVQTPPDAGTPVGWVQFDAVPPPDECFGLLPAGREVRAVVTGAITMVREDLRVEIVVYDREDLDEEVASTVQATVPLGDPAGALCKLARRLARLVGIPFQHPPQELMTASGPAFLRFLEGLDGSALLSGDLEIEVRDDAEVLMQPYADALRLDPTFGLALRAAHVTLFAALEDARIGEPLCRRLVDSYLAVRPADGEACVQIADQLAGLGDDQRARAWLEHATHLHGAPAKSFENLGILCANTGDMAGARNLWLDGLDVNGHPDFLAHLARLAFAEGNPTDAWEKILRGLRRIYERCARAGEWGDEGQDLGLLLRYLVDHIQEFPVPPEVCDAVADLCGQLAVPEDRVDLGRCLLLVGRPEAARAEVTAALGEDLDPAYRDEGVRALLGIDVPGFDRRFAKASEDMTNAADPRPALAEMEEFLRLQPEFWPAIYLRAIGCRRIGEEEQALDCLADVLSLCPGQVEALFEMAELFAGRGNPKRAVECVTEALETHPDDPQLHAARARYLLALDRVQDARQAVASAIKLAPGDPEIRRLQRRLAKLP